MAAPGLGVGDIVKACDFIYTTCRRYRDAHDEFDEISGKAGATMVVLQRIDTEAKTKGNLVERAGPVAFGQLEDNLQSLRKDARTLEALVTKYKKIERDGPGRRLLWALKESGNLTDLRRRIGNHEQALNIWYMTLVYQSLRRIEGGQEEIIEAIKNLPFNKLDDIRRELYLGNKSRTLERELRKTGLNPEAIDANLTVAEEYVAAPPMRKTQIENEARAKSASIRASANYYPGAPYDSRREVPSQFRHPHEYKPRVYEGHDHGEGSIQIENREYHHRKSSKDKNVSRSKSTSHRPKPPRAPHSDTPRVVHINQDIEHTEGLRPIIISSDPIRHSDKEPENIVPRRYSDTSKYHAEPSPRKEGRSELVVERRKSDASKHRASPSPRREEGPKVEKEYIVLKERRSSDVQKQAPPPSPLLVVPSLTGSITSGGSPYRQYTPTHRRTRSADVRRPKVDDEENDYEVVVIEDSSRSRSQRRESNPATRDSSTHSYTRRRSTSRESQNNGYPNRPVRIVQRLDRIDSVPIPEPDSKGKDSAA